MLALMALIPVQAYASGSVPTTPSGIPISEIENRTDQIMKKYIGTAIPGAAVSIVKDGKIVFFKRLRIRKHRETNTHEYGNNLYGGRFRIEIVHLDGSNATG